MEAPEALHVAPTDAELERAIASVPGVAEAAVRHDEQTGRSRLRLRLAPGEDADQVSWAVAATLRERFGIALDPHAIRPLPAATTEAAADDPVRLVTDAGSSADPASSPPPPPGAPGHVATGATNEVPAAPGIDDPGAPGAEPAAGASDAEPATEVSGAEPAAGASDAEPATAAARTDAAGGDTGPTGVPVEGTASGLGHSSLAEHARAAELDATRLRLTRAAAAALEAAVRVETVAPTGAPQDATSPLTADEPQTATAALAAVPPLPDEHDDERADAQDDERDDQRDDAVAGSETTPAAAEAPDAGAAPARAAAAARAPERHRAVIRHLDTQRDEIDVRVTATLELDGKAAHGRAITVPTSGGVMRAVAEATVGALRELTGERLLCGVDRISLHPAHEPAMATVVVTLLTDRGEETLLGGSIVRGDPEHAVMRATLDALNRRVARLLPPDQDASAD